jgi:uncharacterized repeat protein (TIGR02543 family)
MRNNLKKHMLQLTGACLMILAFMLIPAIPAKAQDDNIVVTGGTEGVDYVWDYYGLDIQTGTPLTISMKDSTQTSDISIISMSALTINVNITIKDLNLEGGCISLENKIPDKGSNTITLEGNSKIIANGGDSIYSNGDLTITGKGDSDSLTLGINNNSNYYIPIKSYGSITINGGQLTIVGQYTCIDAVNNINIYDGIINCNSTTYPYSLFSTYDGKTVISGGKITLSSNPITYQTCEITGGLFADQNASLASADGSSKGSVYGTAPKDGYFVVSNDDSATKADYPVKIEKGCVLSYVSSDTGMGTVDKASEAIPAAIGTPSGATAGAKEGHHFVNWTDSNKAVVCADAKFTPAPSENNYADATYTANFTANTFKIKFDLNGHGTSPVNDIDATYGDEVQEPEAPTADGYIFGGWYKEAKCNSKWDFSTDKDPNDNAVITLYAKWTKEDETAVTLDRSSLSIKIGDSEVLNATVTPSSAASLGISWVSDNEKVATVDDHGKVTAIAEGTAEITAISKDTSCFASATCKVTVTNSGDTPSAPDEDIPSGKEGEEYKATLEASGTAPFKWSFESGSLPDGLSFDSSTGVISGTPSEKGTFTFTVKVTDSTGAATEIPVTITVASKTSNEAQKPAARVCTHPNIAWETTKEATSTDDGEMAYRCPDCGYVEQRLPISGYTVFIADTCKTVKNAAAGATVKITTDRWVSFHHSVIEQLQKRPDVGMDLKYRYKGKAYEILIPAGTDLSSLIDKNGYIGFLQLAAKLGATQVSK